MKKIYKHFNLYAIYLTLAALLISGSIFAYLLLKDSGEKTINVEGTNLYTQRFNATDYQKELFTELETVINNSEATGNEIAASVVKNYIADFYTWTNKQGSHDVGGLGFVFSPSTLYIQSQAKAYFYKDLTYFIELYGAENLLQVDSITVKYADAETNFVMGTNEYPSYYVGVEWTYVPNEIFSPLSYQNKGYFSVLVRDGKFEIYRYFKE